MTNDNNDTIEIEPFRGHPYRDVTFGCRGSGATYTHNWMTTISERWKCRVQEVHREWSVEGLPKELQHESIAFYRDVGLYRGVYQIGFAQSWMPYDYRPDTHKITHARVERHHPPHRSWWKRLLASKRNYLVIVVEEPEPTFD